MFIFHVRDSNSVLFLTNKAEAISIAMEFCQEDFSGISLIDAVFKDRMWLVRLSTTLPERNQIIVQVDGCTGWIRGYAKSKALQ